LKLSLTVPAHLGETATSLASRLAARNFQSNVRTFATDMGMAFPHIVEGQPDALDNLAILSGADREVLFKSSFIRGDGRSFWLNGQRITAPNLRRQSFVCCPICMVQDMKAGLLDPAINAYGRAIWSIVQCRTCITHGVAHVKIGEVPPPAMIHDFTAAVRLHEGTIYRLAEEPVLRTASDFERNLVDRIGGKDRGSGWLDSLDFSVAVKACEVFGAVAEFGRTVNLKRLSGPQWAAAGAAGYDILRRGTATLRAFLSDLQRAEAFKGIAGPKKVFGRIYEWLHEQDPANDPVRDVVREHIVETMPIDAGEEVLGKINQQRRIHSIRSLALQTGIHPITVRKVLAITGEVAADDDRQDNSIALPAASGAEMLLTRMSSAMTQLGVREYLNVNRVSAALLAGSGYLPVVLVTEGMDQLYHPDDLDQFMARLTANAVPVQHCEPGQVPLTLACKRSNAKLLEVVDLVLHGKLAWVGVLSSEHGLPSVLVNLAEVKEKVKLAPVDGIAISAVAGDLGVTDTGARFLADTSALATRIVINPANRCPMTVVPFADYRQFKVTYVSLRDIARSRGLPSRRMLNELARSGILPVASWRKNGAILFRRSDLL